MSKKMNDFVYGAVFKVEREQSMEEIRANFRSMKEIGFDTVVIWPAVYWWEEKGPEYPYATGKALLRCAEEEGIGIVMELAGQITAMEYVPDFLCKEEYYCVDRKGCRNLGTVSYGYLNFNHPEVQGLIEKQYTEIAKAYHAFPALKGYDIWNETQFASFDVHTLGKFQEWLQKKYVTLRKLNDSWDRMYESWGQIQFTPWMWASVMAVVDYHQFQKDNIGMILRYMRAAIEKVDTEHAILADNIHATVTMDSYYERPSDDWGVAKEVDRYGISFYPKFFTRHTPAVRRHQVMTGAHSASRDGVFSISEMQTHHASMFNPEGSVSEEELWQWCWEAVGHGAKGLIYWKWDPFRKGVQTGGRGLLDSSGKETVRAKTARRIHEVLSKEPLLTEAKPEQETAAILYDSLNHDFIKAYTIGFQGTGIGAPASLYLDSIAGLYNTLWQKNIPVKFVTPEDLCHGEMQKYRVLFVTTQVTMDEKMAQALLSYMKNGGTVICDGKFGEVDETGLLYRMIPGAGLSQELGFELVDFEEGNLEFDVQGLKVQGGHDRRQIREENLSAQVKGVYQDGRPAVLKAAYGEGCLYYVSTFLWFGCRHGEHTGAKELLDVLLEGYSLTTVGCSEPDISVQRLDGKEGSLVFAFHYGNDGKFVEFTVCGNEDSDSDTKESICVQEITTDCEVECKQDGNTVYFKYDMQPDSAVIFKVFRKKLRKEEV